LVPGVILFSLIARNPQRVGMSETRWASPVVLLSIVIVVA